MATPEDVRLRQVGVVGDDTPPVSVTSWIPIDFVLQAGQPSKRCKHN